MSSNKLTENLDLYHSTFKAYCRNSNKDQLTYNWLDTQIREVTNSLEVSDDDVTRVLSIGPGDGEIEDRLLTVIRDRNETVHPVKATVVEPSFCMVEEYQRRVDTEGIRLYDISYDWRAETLNAYLENGANDGTKFHFISAMHSVYYFQDLPGTLKDLYRRLEPGGMMQISAVTEVSGVALNTDKKEHRPQITSQEVQAACIMENIPILYEFLIEERTDITACFERPEDMTEDGRLLLDFFSHVNDFTETTSPETQEEFLRFIKSLSEEKDGKILFKADWKSFVIMS